MSGGSAVTRNRVSGVARCLDSTLGLEPIIFHPTPDAGPSMKYSRGRHWRKYQDQALATRPRRPASAFYGPCAHANSA